jgi:hypothetical protein
MKNRKFRGMSVAALLQFRDITPPACCFSLLRVRLQDCLTSRPVFAVMTGFLCGVTLSDTFDLN